MSDKTTTARITRITQSPETINTPWTQAVARGKMALRYRITALAAVPGIEAPVEVDVYMPAGLWERGKKTVLTTLPMFTSNIVGVPAKVDFDVWVEKRSAYGAFPEYNEEGEFLGLMGFELGGVHYDAPDEAAEAFLSKGDGWRITIPEGALVIDKEGGRPRITSWKDKKSGAEHERAHAKVIGFDLDWLVPPHQREEVEFSLRGQRRREELATLGEKPVWVRR